MHFDTRPSTCDYRWPCSMLYSTRTTKRQRYCTYNRTVLLIIIYCVVIITLLTRNLVSVRSFIITSVHSPPRPINNCVHKRGFDHLLQKQVNRNTRSGSGRTQQQQMMNAGGSDRAGDDCPSSFQSLAAFLELQSVTATATTTRQGHPYHMVIGNQAGDADSIISAIALAYVQSSMSSTTFKTPVVSIPRADLATQRPETMLLFRLAGLEHDSLEHLHHVDGSPLLLDTEQLDVTLVDHNRLAEAFAQQNLRVVEIWDHHKDEQAHRDVCSSENIHIAFKDGKATVASTCTLVAEQLFLNLQLNQAQQSHQIDVALSVLLLGTILLDSVNMSPAAGKGTARDAHAIQQLLEQTDWTLLKSPWARATLGMTNTDKRSSQQPNTSILFQALQDAKFDIEFWKSLSVRDALRMDYKNFRVNNHKQQNEKFGMATVLLPMPLFWAKNNNNQDHGVTDSCLTYMKEQEIDFMAIMLTSTAKDATSSSSSKSISLQRELILCARNNSTGTDTDTNMPASALLNRLARYLNSNENTVGASLELEEVTDQQVSTSSIVEKSNNELSVLCFTQGNAKLSRKQVAPMMMDFFQEFESSSL